MVAKPSYLRSSLLFFSLLLQQPCFLAFIRPGFRGDRNGYKGCCLIWSSSRPANLSYSHYQQLGTLTLHNPLLLLPKHSVCRTQVHPVLLLAHLHVHRSSRPDRLLRRPNWNSLQMKILVSSFFASLPEGFIFLKNTVISKCLIFFELIQLEGSTPERVRWLEQSYLNDPISRV